MILVDEAKCTGCGICARECPVQAIRLENKKPLVLEFCTLCGLCPRVCNVSALTLFPEADGSRAQCDNCLVNCRILEGYHGSCRRYRNDRGRIVRDRSLVIPEQAAAVKAEDRFLYATPLVTGIGAGTTSPCFRPAPYIVEDRLDGVDVVTVASEVPLSYSGLKVKVDTNLFIGEEGAKVRRDGRVVGMVTTEEYGSKMLALGGVNLLHGESGSTAARTVVEIANRQRVKLKVEKGAALELQVGHPPVVDGVSGAKMRVGCGSATVMLFAPHFNDVADEVIALDPQITGLFSEHLGGQVLGKEWSGVTPIGVKSTPGRFFGEAGRGWGGTKVMNALEAVAAIDWTVARPGMRILITDTSGAHCAMLRLTPDRRIEEIEPTAEARRVVQIIQETCEDSRVSAMYIGGLGGSARAGVVKYPINLTRAVHEGKVHLTVGGAPAFLMPGGGITFIVDVEKVAGGAFSWVPTPATVAPMEYTMRKEIYEEIGGHLESVRPLAAALGERETERIPSLELPPRRGI